MIRCKKCDRRFRNISSLRKHQWASHREQFNNVLITGKRPRKLSECGLPMKSSDTKLEIKVARAPGDPISIKSNGHANGMLAGELLDQLKIQRDFMRDVVQLVEGIISRNVA